jgi:hypothetical protein
MGLRLRRIVDGMPKVKVKLAAQGHPTETVPREFVRHLRTILCTEQRPGAMVTDSN